jgi:hypothetical protein
VPTATVVPWVAVGTAGEGTQQIVDVPTTVVTS